MKSTQLWLLAAVGLVGGAGQAVGQEEHWETFVATAYCSCTKCCGPKAQGITASGHRLKPGHRVVAVDPTVIPLRSVVEVQGLGRWAALDTGSAIKGNRIDIWMPSHQDALQYGRRTVKLRVLSRGARAGYDKPLPGHEQWGALPTLPSVQSGPTSTAAAAMTPVSTIIPQFAWTEQRPVRRSAGDAACNRERRWLELRPTDAATASC